MNINRNNYEAYIIEYLDGNLDAVAVSELLLFIEQHPDIAAEFEGLSELSPLSAEPIEMEKNGLKKPEYSEIKETYNTLLVARLEGDISIPETIQLNQGLARYPELKKDAALFAQTRIHPDTQIVFPNKHKLKKPVIGMPVTYAVFSRIAAILVLASGLFWLSRDMFYTADTQPVAVLPTTQNEVAQTKQPATQPAHQSVAQTRVLPVQKTIRNVQPESTDIVLVKMQELASNSIDSRSGSFESNIVPLSVELKPVSPTALTYIAAVQSNVNQSRDEFPTLAGLARNKLMEKTGTPQQNDNKLNQTIAVNAFNKLTGAGLKFEKDSTSGKINRFEITGLGLEWIAKK